MSILTRSQSRDGSQVRVLAVHTTEGGGTAEALRDAAWWTGSAHAIADKRGVLLTPAEGCVPYDRAAWTLRSGNPWSENIELIGFAASSREQWLRDEAQLNACAKWLAARSKARGIPLVKLTPQQYRAGASGVIGHVDHTVGYNDGTHWDPGPGFPWDVVIATARDYAGGIEFEGDDMSAEDVKQITGWMTAVRDQLSSWMRSEIRDQVVSRIARVDGRVAGLEEVVKQLAGRQGTEVDLAAVREASRLGARQGTAEAVDAIDTTVRFDTGPDDASRPGS